MSNKSGFTLIEILIVLFIVGITLGFALLAFGDFGASRRVTVAAEQFEGYVKLVQQQAILEMATLGVLVTPERYQAMRYSPSGWQAMPPRGVFRARDFPLRAQVLLETNLTVPRNTPQIVINESGDMNAFKLVFQVKGDVVTTVVAQQNGLIKIKPAGNT